MAISSPFDTGDRCLIDSALAFQDVESFWLLPVADNLVVKKVGLFAVRSHLSYAFQTNAPIG